MISEFLKEQKRYGQSELVELFKTTVRLTASARFKIEFIFGVT